MAEDRAVVAETQEVSQGRTSSGEPPAVPGRHTVGPAERGPLAGSAEGIPVGEHLLAAAAGVGGPGALAANLAGIPGAIGCPGPVGLVGDLRRWEFCPGEKRGPCVGATQRGKGTKWMVVVDGQGIPLGKHLDSASPNEVTLIEKTLDAVAVPRQGPGRPKKTPQRLIYDRAADSDPLRKRMAKRGTELICPHRANRSKPKTQDGRKLRRYKRRWKVERTFAWLGNFRRLVVRYERSIVMYSAFFHLACLIITLRQF